MPIPDTPYTRREAYLNAAATGDSSGIPETPYTREEMYLDAIARGGGGGGGGGSSTLSGLTDVDISNPANGQTLVYNAESGKWENGAGGGDIFETLGTISAATVPMTYDEEEQMWVGNITTDITPTGKAICAGRNLALKINGQLYTVDVVMPNVAVGIDETVDAEMYFTVQADAPIYCLLNYYESDAPVITELSMEVYAPIPELEVFFSSGGSPK